MKKEDQKTKRKVDDLIALQRRRDDDRKAKAEALARSGLPLSEDPVSSADAKLFGFSRGRRVVGRKDVMVCGRRMRTVAYASAGSGEREFDFEIRLTAAPVVAECSGFRFSGFDLTLHSHTFEDLSEGVLWSIRTLADCHLSGSVLFSRKTSEEVSRE